MITKDKIIENIFNTYYKNYKRYVGFSETMVDHAYTNTDKIFAYKRIHDPDKVTVNFNNIHIADYYDRKVSLQDINFIKEIEKEGYFDDMREVYSKIAATEFNCDNLFDNHLENVIKYFGVSLNDIEFEVIEDNINYIIYRLDGIFDKTVEPTVEGYDDDLPKEIKIIAKYYNGIKKNTQRYIETYYDIKFGDNNSYKEYNIFVYGGSRSFSIIDEVLDNQNTISTITNNREIIYNREKNAEVVELTKMNSFFVVDKIENDVAGSIELGSDDPILQDLDPVFYNCFGIPEQF